jgi:hypothetical protein
MKRFDRGKIPDMPLLTAYKKRIPIRCVQINEPFQVQSMEGLVTGKTGDYLMIGNHGDTYICDREIFEKTYETKENPDIHWVLLTFLLVYAGLLMSVLFTWTIKYPVGMAFFWPCLAITAWLQSKTATGWYLVYKIIGVASFLFVAGLLIRELW